MPKARTFGVLAMIIFWSSELTIVPGAVKLYDPIVTTATSTEAKTTEIWREA